MYKEKMKTQKNVQKNKKNHENRQKQPKKHKKKSCNENNYKIFSEYNNNYIYSIQLLLRNSACLLKEAAAFLFLQFSQSPFK